MTAAAARRRRIVRKATKARPAAKVAVKPVRPSPHAPEIMMFRVVCKAPWAVIVERTPNALGTRFVCPFCPHSHRVPGPVRGFRKLPRVKWSRLRPVQE
jgi:hypothetical protein